MLGPKKHVSFASLVHALRAHFEQLPDYRRSGKLRYTLPDVVMSGFACMFFQDRSLLQFQRRMQDEEQRGNLSSLFGVEHIPEDTQLRDILDALPSESFRPLFKEYFARLQRGKHLEPFRIFGNRYLVSIDGTQYFASSEISCEHCLTKEHKDRPLTYHHQALQAAVVHPAMRQAIPLMAEDIRNEDGKKKQDCETNAAKRLLDDLRMDHPQLDIVLLGDGLFSHNPMVAAALEHRMDFIFTAKPDDHKYMMQWVKDGEADMPQLRLPQKDGRVFSYRWLNDVPLTGAEDAFNVNYFELEILVPSPSEDSGFKCTYRCSWVTNLTLTSDNIEEMVKAARCRWKIENECFNNLKNQGYCLEHNYGHGSQFLAFNFYLLTLLAFFYHQVFELTDHLYQEARQRWSKVLLWETLRAAIKFFFFQTWEQILRHCLAPPQIHSTAPP
jgi:hypothetical protein